MFEVENEVADEAVSSEAVESTESVETSDVADESVDVAADSDGPVDTGETAADALEEAPQVYDWNGELDGIKKAEWFTSLDENIRETALRGMTAKYRNLERGYTKAFQEAALQRRALEAREKEIQATELRVQKWLHGDIDPMAEKQKELEMLRVNHEAALQTLRKEHEQAMLKRQAETASSIDELIAAREAAEDRAHQLEQLEAQREQAAMEAEVDQFERWIEAEAPHVYNDKDALYALCVQVASGIQKEDALEMVLGKYRMPEPEVVEPEPVEPEPVPAAVDMMNMGASPAANTTEQSQMSFDERMDLLRRQYMAEAAAQRNS